MMLLSMPHINLAGLVITPADCFLGTGDCGSPEDFTLLAARY
jgi:hypothetical protein